MRDRTPTPPGLAIQSGQEDGSYTIELRGEFDLAGREAVLLVLRQAEDSDAKRILVDLGGLDFIDSTGISVFFAASRSDGGQGRLCFTRPSGDVGRVFDLTGLDATVTFVD